MALEAATLCEVLTAVDAREGEDAEVLAHVYCDRGALLGLEPAVVDAAAVHVVDLLAATPF